MPLSCLLKSIQGADKVFGLIKYGRVYSFWDKNKKYNVKYLIRTFLNICHILFNMTSSGTNYTLKSGPKTHCGVTELFLGNFLPCL